MKKNFLIMILLLTLILSMAFTIILYNNYHFRGDRFVTSVLTASTGKQEVDFSKYTDFKWDKAYIVGANIDEMKKILGEGKNNSDYEPFEEQTRIIFIKNDRPVAEAIFSDNQAWFSDHDIYFYSNTAVFNVEKSDTIFIFKYKS